MNSQNYTKKKGLLQLGLYMNFKELVHFCAIHTKYKNVIKKKQNYKKDTFNYKLH